MDRMDDGSVELGYWVARPFWGLGYATEAGRHMIDLARTMGIRNLVASHFVDNPASLAVSRKVGYVPNGDVRMTRRPGECAVNRALLLTPGAFVRPEAPVEVEGAAAVRRFLGIDAVTAG